MRRFQLRFARGQAVGNSVPVGLLNAGFLFPGQLVWRQNLRGIIAAVDACKGIATTGAALLETGQFRFRQGDLFARLHHRYALRRDIGLRRLDRIAIIRSVDPEEGRTARYKLTLSKIGVYIDQLPRDLGGQCQFLARAHRARTGHHQISRTDFERFGLHQRNLLDLRFFFRFGPEQDQSCGNQDCRKQDQTAYNALPVHLFFSLNG